MKQKKTYIRSISTRGRYADGDTHKTATSRYTGERAILYAKGGAVAVSRAGIAAYMGTDMLGSVRSVTDGYGAVESYRDYDIFGTPYGDAAVSGSGSAGGGMSVSASVFAGGVDFGYAGKPYDAATGMYNYGFRDYAPTAARFTTLDPIRDGRNWFAYVNGDPVNFVDLWGLSAGEPTQGGNLAPSLSSVIRNIGNNGNTNYNSPFAIGAKIDDTTPMTGEIKYNSSSATQRNFNGYTIIGNRMGEPSTIPNVVVIITFDGTKNQAQAHVGTASVYHTQRDVTADNYTSVKSNGILVTSLPVVSGGLDKETGIEYPRTEAGFYPGIYPEPTSTSSNPILKDFDHGGEDNSMYRIDRENGIAIHQANNLYSVATSRTESCTAVTSYMKEGAGSNYDLFKYSTEPYGYVPQNGITVVVEE